MLTRIAGGEVIDPANGRAGVGDVFLRDGLIVARAGGGPADRTSTQAAASSWPAPSTSIPISAAAM